MEKKKVYRADTTQNSRVAISNGLNRINHYLAMIKDRLEILMLTDLPAHIMTDLIEVYQAEREASEIVRSIKVLCHPTK